MDTSLHALIERFMPLANKLAFEKKRNLPRYIDVEELQSAAYLGLVEAASRFDTNKGTAFSTFAYPRISGAINDYLRSLGLTKPLSLDSSDEDEGCLADTLAAKSENNFEEVLEVVTQDLGEDATFMLRCYFVDELPMKEIGNRCGVTEGRVSQIFSSYKKQIASRWTKSELISELAA